VNPCSAAVGRFRHGSRSPDSRLASQETLREPRETLRVYMYVWKLNLHALRHPRPRIAEISDRKLPPLGLLHNQ